MMPNPFTHTPFRSVPNTVSCITKTSKKISKNEGIIVENDFPCGTIEENITVYFIGSISADNTQLTMFHGTYLQDDRDKRRKLINERKEKAFHS